MLDGVPARPRGKPDLPPTAPELEPPARSPRRRPGQIVLVQQGGGALGARRVGVYRALMRRGSSPTGSSAPPSARSTSA
jgi:NTE family protein